MSSDIAVRVEGLGKKYRLGLTHAGSVREAVSGLTNRLRRGRRKKAAEADAYEPARLDDDGKSFWALNDISFEVPRGEVLGVIGRNGAGKSTLLKILSRITHPTEGYAELHGRIGSLLEVGTGFHPELTGRENVFMNGTILGMTRREVAAKFDEIVSFSGVEKFINTPVKRYSSGMRVRLGFAVAAHLEPEILIIDEVLAVGDIEFQSKCIGKMRSVASAGRTIIFVSHNMSAVYQLCDNAVLVNNGRAGAVQPTSDAVADYVKLNQPCGSRESSRHIRNLTIASFTHGSEVVEAGGGVKFELELILPDVDREYEVGVIICDQRGTRVTALNSHVNSRLRVCGGGQVRLTCIADSLNLVPDTYRVDVAVASPGYGVVERIEGFATLRVVFDDVFGSGMLPRPQQSLLLTKAGWSLS